MLLAVLYCIMLYRGVADAVIVVVDDDGSGNVVVR